MPKDPKITTGPNDRPSDETISQTGEGLPDDSSKSLETTEREIERTRKALEGQQPSRQEDDSDTSERKTGASAESVCRRCGGTGEINGETCPDCGGTGKLNQRPAPTR